MPDAAQLHHGWSTPQSTGPILIRRYVVQNPSASVTIDGLPQGYQDLVLRVTGISDTTTGNFTNLQVQFNGDAAANKYGTGEVHYAGAVVGSETLNSTFTVVGQVPTRTASNIVTRPGITHCLVMGYASTTWQKQMLSQNYSQPQDAASFAQPRIYGGIWKDVSVIRSVTFTPALGSFVAGSQFDVYGEP